MSDILIKGMEMPKGCATCPYCDRAWNKPKCKAKSMQGRFMEQRLNLDRARQKWCPLVPIPEHGRLIDADALMHEFDKAQRTMEQHGREYSCSFLSSSQEISTEWYCVEDMVENAPTIIPAEEAKE